ncbi:MAG: HAMP domain-containing sensor histidine kinase [Desulfobacterales bacterium]
MCLINSFNHIKNMLGKIHQKVSLRVALVVYVLMPMAGVSASVGYWSLQAFERQVEKRMQYDLEMVARAIKRPLSHAIKRDREGSIAQTLESAFSVDQVYGAYVYDSTGKKISIIGSREPYTNPEQMSKMASHGEQYGEYGRVAGQEVYSYFVPLTDSGGRITGLLQLTRQSSDFQNQIRDTRLKAIGVFIATFLGLTGLVFYGHHRALGKHLNLLSNSMQKIANGNRHHRFSPGGPSEIVALGSHFNRMMDNIDQAEMEIRQQRAEQKELENRLRQVEKMAAIGQLSAGVAHELGTPLSVIQGKAQRALRRNDISPHAAESFKEIRYELQRVERIIRQLLDFSRKSEIRVRLVKMSQLAESAVSALSVEAGRHRTRLILEKACDEVIDVDPVRMEQALSNLIKNAIQAAKGGEVRVSWFVDSTGAKFEVADNGPGIHENAKSKIFEPFFTTKAVGEGTGLGLAVVHGIVEEHGGCVEVGKSDLGGANFIVHIPLKAEKSREKNE